MSIIDANITHPIDGTRRVVTTGSHDAAYTVPARHSGPLSTSGAHHHSGPIARPASTSEPPSQPGYARPYVQIPTRPLYPAAQAFSEGRLRLASPRRKFEVWCDLIHPSGCRDRLTLAGIMDSRNEPCVMIMYRAEMMVAHDLATLWRAMMQWWPAGAEAQWQFEDFPRWDDARWAAGWEDIQAKAIKRTGGLR